MLNAVHTLNVVQLSAVPSIDDELGPRERNRLSRHRSYVTAALHVVFAEGLDALTMQRLAAEVGASVGSVYTYFPSKGALIAEVQREAIERLASSAVVLGTDVDHAVAERDLTPDAAALAPIAAFGRFWLTASDAFPEEMRLLLLLLSEGDETVPPADAGRVVPAAVRLLGLAEQRIERAVAAGVLSEAEGADRRTVALAAALTGCVQLAVVERWDRDLLAPRSTGRSVLDALLGGWGADRAAIVEAHALVDQLEATGPLARPVPSGGSR